jgi:hypothetical protein
MLLFRFEQSPTVAFSALATHALIEARNLAGLLHFLWSENYPAPRSSLSNGEYRKARKNNRRVPVGGRTYGKGGMISEERSTLHSPGGRSTRFMT